MARTAKINQSVNEWLVHILYIIIYLKLLFCFQHKTVTDTKTSKAVADGTHSLASSISCVYLRHAYKHLLTIALVHLLASYRCIFSIKHDCVLLLATAAM